MELQISFGIWTQIQKNANIRTDKKRKDLGVILRRLCEQKGIEIIEAELFPDHIHMLVSIP